MCQRVGALRESLQPHVEVYCVMMGAYYLPEYNFTQLMQVMVD